MTLDFERLINRVLHYFLYLIEASGAEIPQKGWIFFAIKNEEGKERVK